MSDCRCGHSFWIHEADDGLIGEDGPCWDDPNGGCPCERYTPELSE